MKVVSMTHHGQGGFWNSCRLAKALDSSLGSYRRTGHVSVKTVGRAFEIPGILSFGVLIKYPSSPLQGVQKQRLYPLVIMLLEAGLGC
jgi:hypothetical protein